MAKWDLSKLPEGRKPLDDAWFAERAQMQERINGLEERLEAATNDAKEAEAYAGELEAKLAKAVEVAEKSIKWLRLYGADVHREATTLAELKGGNDDYHET